MKGQLESLRLGVGLAHAVPDANLRVRNGAGAVLIAGTGPEFDVSLCALRQVVAASCCPSKPDVSDWATCLELSGSLRVHEAGLYVAPDPESGSLTVWFATLIWPDRIRELIRQPSWPDIPDELVEMVIKPDRCLAMTSVAIRSAVSPATDFTALRVATDLYRVCLVEELTRSGCPAEARSDRLTAPSSLSESEHRSMGVVNHGAHSCAAPRLADER